MGHGENLQNELRRDESRLDSITREVDALRDQVLRPEAFEPWQAEQVAMLRREHAQARLTSSRQNALLQEERRKLKIAQEVLRRAQEGQEQNRNAPSQLPLTAKESSLIPIVAA